jgi:membrane protease YdiL (CAAX protease family)
MTVVLMAAIPVARAELLRNVTDDLVEAPAPDVAVDQANGAALAQFETALAIYDRQIEQQPSDVIAQLHRCRFMNDFAASYEIAEFAMRIREQAHECMEQFDVRFPGHPETQLRQLQANMVADDVLKQGEALLSAARARASWTNGQLGRLYTLLARTADGDDNAERALHYALLALQMDEESNVRLIAATHLIARGEKARALEILRAPIDSAEDGENGWELTRKMDLLVKAGAAQEAVALFQRRQDVRYYSRSEAARLLLAAGATELARRELAEVDETSEYSAADEAERFRLELEHGTAEAAFAAYQAWRDLGWEVDPLGFNRFALLARDASLPWKPRDALGVFAFGSLCVLLALLAAVPIVAVHYRGLAVRATNGDPYPRSDWSLRRAWLALSVFFIASLLALYFGGALDLRFDDTLLWDFEPTTEQFSRIALANALLAVFVLMPFAASARPHAADLWSSQWSIAKCLTVGAAIAIALRLPMLLAWLARPDSLPAIAQDDVLWQMLSDVLERYGWVAALWILSVAAPVAEEFLFRGILYRAFAAHLQPLWANLLQAALFSAMHLEGLKGSILLFVLGLALGSVARRSGGLLAPMVLHAIFNLIAALMILRVPG